MTTEEALLAAIWASPHDDLPRLVYADWLDESADPTKAARAEFIRVQCELARVGWFDDRTESLQEAEQRLRDEWRREWLPRQRPKQGGIGFHRGMFYPGYDDIKSFRTEASLVRAVAPLYSLGLRSYDGFEQFSKWPPAEGLHRLVLSLWFTGWGKHIAASPLTKNLAHLTVGGSIDTPSDFDRLCRATHLIHLTELSLSEFQANGDVINRLLTAPFAHQLRTLVLGAAHEFDSGGFVKLLAPDSLSRLEYLRLVADTLRYPWEGFLRKLAEKPNSHRLKCLRVSSGSITEDGCLALLDWPGAGTLRELSLTPAHPDPAPPLASLRIATLITLLESDRLPQLKKLTARPIDYDRRVSEDPDGRLAKLRQLAQDRGVRLELW